MAEIGIIDLKLSNIQKYRSIQSVGMTVCIELGGGADLIHAS